MSGWLHTLIESYGTLAVFVGTAVEGDAVALSGGVLVHQGHLVLWQVIMAVVGGAYLTDLVIFAFGRAYRDGPRVRRVLEHGMVSTAIERLSHNLVLFALVFRFIPGMRTVGPLTLAAAGMRPASYAGFTLASAMAWGTTLVMLGYSLGHVVEVVFGKLERIEYALIAPFVVAVLVGLWVHRARRRRQASAG